MLSPVTVALAGLAWLAVLFGVALFGERRTDRLERVWPVVYALSLAVYCTAWTFYGTVTQAARWGAWLPPTFLGTIALFAFGTPFLARLAEVARAQNSASLADLIASRFGKDAKLAATITAVAVLGMVPYVALQLKAVAMSYATLVHGTDEVPAWQDAALYVAVVMAVFAMLFGTRRAAATEHNRGLVLAMGVESLLKLGAVVAVGAWAVWGANDGYTALAARAATLPPAKPDSAYYALIGLGALAMFTLPHQFHVGIVELARERHLKTARWLFPLYLVLIALPVLPLAWAGQLAFGGRVASDLYVLALPLSQSHQGLALLTFLGGVSAATGMVILSAITLSIMIANHWILPGTLRGASARGPSLRPVVLAHRRLGIVLVLALAWAYSRAIAGSDVLADIGALSFSALAQLAPAVVAAVYRPDLPGRAVHAGIVAGALAWIWLLLVPVAVQAGIVPDSLAWLSPDSWFGADGRQARGVLLSLAVNVGMIALVARAAPRAAQPQEMRITVGTLADLAARFLPAAQVGALVRELPRGDLAPRALVDAMERELAAVIGAASARVLVRAAREGQGAPLDTVAELVGEASQALRFNQRLLEAALENMSQGISVVDKDLRLVAWNQRYAELFAYPPALLEVGVPVEALVRHNAGTGLLDAANEAAIDRRLAHMRAGTPYVTEREFPNGQVIEIRGTPMPGGGFVATFTDVTEFRRGAAVLERRVAERTAELEQAKGEAERANRAKSRFLAAVSHDLLQPINAAHLFTHALSQSLRHAQYREAVANIDGALGSAEGLLAGLLDISRLDAGGMVAHVRTFRVDDWLAHLAAEFGVLAAERGLRLDCVPSRAIVRSDPQLLRRVLQNFLSNAVRYTGSGRILLGCRRHGDALRIEVWDTGPGIAPEHQALIFEEFRRLDRGGSGLGLGLAIAERIARLLGHRLVLRSRPGRGTMFGIEVPLASEVDVEAVAPPQPAPRAPRSRALVVDNDAAALKGMQALLAGWHVEVLAARNLAEAERSVANARPDILLLDYHLDGGATGLDVARSLRATLGTPPVVIITADHSETLRGEIAEAGAHLLHKPLKPLALKSLMARLLATRTQA